VIHRLARGLVRLLERRDPLSERVHFKPAGVAGLTAAAIVEGLVRRLTRWGAAAGRKAQA